MRKRALIIIPLFFMIIGVGIAYVMNANTIKNNKSVLPIIQPIDLKEEMVDSSVRGQGIGHRIGYFSFLDQNGNTFTLNDVKGKVFVAEYFFTTCNNICPIMNRKMKRVQKEFYGNPNLDILSFTVDPATDSVPVMKAYAKEHHANYGQWFFLTGDKDSLYSLARKSFFVLKPEVIKNKDGSYSNFIHTNNFVLVDRKLRIRGYYDGTDSTKVNQLIHDIKHLLQKGS